MATKKKPAKATAAKKTRRSMTDHDNEVKKLEHKLSKTEEALKEQTIQVENLQQRLAGRHEAYRELSEQYLAMKAEMKALQEDDISRADAALQAYIAKSSERKFIRGKLPGEKLIKVDIESGAFEEVTPEEWHALAK
jgi:cell division protein FtsB